MLISSLHLSIHAADKLALLSVVTVTAALFCSWQSQNFCASLVADLSICAFIFSGEGLYQMVENWARLGVLKAIPKLL